MSGALDGLDFLGSPAMRERIARDSRLSGVLARVGRLAGLESRPQVLPDAATKAFGLPSGLRFITRRWLYPAAAPDVADGYLVLDTGLDHRFAGDVRERPEEYLSCLRRTVSDRPLFDRGPVGREAAADRLLSVGECAVTSDLVPCSHNGARSPATAERRVAGTDAEVSAAMLGALGAMTTATGQFVSVYRVARGSARLRTGSVVLVVHVGAEVLRETLYHRVIFPLLERAVRDGLPEQDALDGLCGLRDDDPLARQYAAIVRAAGLVAGAVRRQTAVRVLDALTDLSGRRDGRAASRLLQHSRHVYFGSDRGRYEHRRGVQLLGARWARTCFVSGGPHGPAFLLQPGLHGRRVFVFHGTSEIRLRDREVEEIFSAHRSDLGREVVRAQSERAVTNFRQSPEQTENDAAHLLEAVDHAVGCATVQVAAVLEPLLNYRSPAANLPVRSRR